MKNKDGKYLYEYYIKRTGSFYKNLRKTKINISSETIHQLRIDIKKIRAFFLLIKIISDGKFSIKKHYEVFKELFQNAGQIRELSVSLNLLRKYLLTGSDIEDFRKHSVRSLETCKGQLKASLDNFDLKKLNLYEAEILKLCGDLKEEEFQKKSMQFISQEFRKIRKIYNSADSEKGLHNIRKHLRVLREAMDLYLLFDADKKIKSKRKQIKISEDHLGNWHDRVVLSNSINKFISQNTSLQNGGRALKQLLLLIKEDSEEFLDKNTFKVIEE